MEQKLERLERAGIIKPVEFSKWAVPIVPVVKKEGSVRICGDYNLLLIKQPNLTLIPFYASTTSLPHSQEEKGSPN